MSKEEMSELVPLLRDLIRSEVRSALSIAPAIHQADAFMTPAEAAAFTKRGVSTIREWALEGRVNRYGSAGRPLYKRSELLAAAERRAPRAIPTDPEIDSMAEAEILRRAK